MSKSAYLSAERDRLTLSRGFAASRRHRADLVRENIEDADKRCPGSRNSASSRRLVPRCLTPGSTSAPWPTYDVTHRGVFASAQHMRMRVADQFLNLPRAFFPSPRHRRLPHRPKAPVRPKARPGRLRRDDRQPHQRPSRHSPQWLAGARRRVILRSQSNPLLRDATGHRSARDRARPSSIHRGTARATYREVAPARRATRPCSLRPTAASASNPFADHLVRHAHAALPTGLSIRSARFLREHGPNVSVVFALLRVSTGEPACAKLEAFPAAVSLSSVSMATARGSYHNAVETSDCLWNSIDTLRL